MEVLPIVETLAVPRRQKSDPITYRQDSSKQVILRGARKSDPKIDDAEDGARATLIEEGITTWIFGQAIELDLFANMKRGDLPFDLLKHVRQFVAGYEAERCPLWLWEEAILQGYTAFRFLREHRRGRVRIDINNRQLSIEPLP